MTETPLDAIVIGGGIAGLACAKCLVNQGFRVQVLEAAEQVGGRVQTDSYQGFRLDHGFQVLQTAYSENRQHLDLPALRLRSFAPGIMLRIGRRFWRISDPRRRPQDLWSTLRAPIGNWSDRWRLIRLWRRNQLQEINTMFEQPDRFVLEFLQAEGFSKTMCDRFFKPFFAGVCLDGDLTVSANVFRYIFRMFSDGDIALPDHGMGAITQQLAQALPAGSIRTGAKVASFESEGVRLMSGDTITAPSLIIATDAPEAGRLLKRPAPIQPSRSEWCLYFQSDNPPVREPMLIVNGNGTGFINSLCVPSQICPDYAPAGSALIAVVVIGNPFDDDEAARRAVHQELVQWFGAQAHRWRFLRAYHIRHALPPQPPPSPNPFKVAPRIGSGLYLCGETDSVPGIQWALLSGRKAAEAVLQNGGGSLNHRKTNKQE
jgi:phytoene dehydrogenase-like protein